MFEIGDGTLSPNDEKRICIVLRLEAEVLRSLPDPLQFAKPDAVEGVASVGGDRAA